MRVTNKMLTTNLLRNLQSANGKMELLQNRLSSGRAITKPSDDPVRIETSLRLKSTISSMEQWKTNTSEALANLETTEGILGDINSMLQRVRELAVQGANGANSADDRSQIAKEIDQLIQQFQVLANSQVGSKYVFSGSKIDTAPMSATVPVLTAWYGNSTVPQFEVGSNLKIEISVDGRKLFGISDTATGQTSSFFNTLNKLSTGLNNNDQTAISEALGEIDGHIDNVLALRAELGAKTNRVYIIADQLDNTIINLKQNLSDILDADMAETIMEFKSVENVYRAALAVGSQVIQPSLVDFLK